MVKLNPNDIRTKEILDWHGVHLFHFPVSSCSQKTRLCFEFKGIPWTSHIVDLTKDENMSEWYLGINPRGLVPAMVHNGDVHIESNDIITYIDQFFPEKPLIPRGRETEVAELLAFEDSLHMDLRVLTFMFVFPHGGPTKDVETLERYEKGGSGMVAGERDKQKTRELEFWHEALDKGLSVEKAQTAFNNFKKAFNDLEKRLKKSLYLLGDDVSVVDVAWLIYVNRLSLAGYPMEERHPVLHAWFERMKALPEVAWETATPAAVLKVFTDWQKELAANGKRLVDILRV